METKNCPFCGEAIKTQAIKCKYCGEFLNKEEYSNSSIEEPKPVNYVIYPQKLSGAIAIAVFAILGSLIYSLDYGENLQQEIVSNIFATVFCVWLWYTFKTYMQNFKSQKIDNLLIWIISLEVLICILNIIITLLPESNPNSEWSNNDTFGMFLVLFYIIIAVSYIIIYINLGNSLMKIKNDFIGQLKPLGISIISFFPISIFVGFVGEIYEENIVRFIAAAIGSIPFVYMIITFQKSKKHLRRA